MRVGNTVSFIGRSSYDEDYEIETLKKMERLIV